MELNDVTDEVLGAAVRVHRALGPGLLESAYRACLAAELARRGIRFRREVAVPVVYEGMRLDCGYRLDLLVEGVVVVEVKAVASLAPIHRAQMLSYLRLAQHDVGLLINFHARYLKGNAVQRMVLGYTGPDLPGISS